MIHDIDFHQSVTDDAIESYVGECQIAHGEACGFEKIEKWSIIQSDPPTRTVKCLGEVCFLRAQLDPLYKPSLPEEQK